jgi:hypothetical protein
MGKAVALRKEEQTPRHELTAEDLAEQGRKVLEIKNTIMKDGVHYGSINGGKKPSLFKPGAEKLCAAFMLKPEFQTSSMEDPERTINWEKYDYKTRKQVSGTTQGFINYDSSCTLVHIPTGEVWAKNVGGNCNNFEDKYRSQNPYNLMNTVEKMAEKRALVAAVLMGTALSDLFTQDIEDMAYFNGENTAEVEPRKVPAKDKPKKKASKPKPQAPVKSEDGQNSVRLATDKQVAYIKTMIGKQKIPELDFFSVWVEDFDHWEGIPFHKVNDILAWIREQ